MDTNVRYLFDNKENFTQMLINEDNIRRVIVRGIQQQMQRRDKAGINGIHWNKSLKWGKDKEFMEWLWVDDSAIVAIEECSERDPEQNIIDISYPWIL